MADGSCVAVGGCQVMKNGAFDYEGWAVKITPAGNTECNRTYGTALMDVSTSIAGTYGGAQMEMVSAVAVAHDGYIIAGQTASSGADDSDMWLLKAGFQSNLPPEAQP